MQIKTSERIVFICVCSSFTEGKQEGRSIELNKLVFGKN